MSGRKPAESFEDLEVWQKAHRWVLEVYRYSQEFPSEERYGLCSQLRRSAISVPSNIAEGFKRRSQREKLRFLQLPPRRERVRCSQSRLAVFSMGHRILSDANPDEKEA